jgi:acyl-coenzyme A thioesterase PaaI-like protein
MDCHSNWCAATAVMQRNGWPRPESTVTADFHVRLRRPTPAGKPVRFEARATDVGEDRATVHCEAVCDGKVTSTCDGLFVVVREGHPAYHRWA